MVLSHSFPWLARQNVVQSHTCTYFDHPGCVTRLRLYYLYQPFRHTAPNKLTPIAIIAIFIRKNLSRVPCSQLPSIPFH